MVCTTTAGHPRQIDIPVVVRLALAVLASLCAATATDTSARDADVKQVFASLDLNGNGLLNLLELKRGEGLLTEYGHARTAGSGNGGLQALLKKADTDGNRMICLDELVAALDFSAPEVPPPPPHTTATTGTDEGARKPAVSPPDDAAVEVEECIPGWAGADCDTCAPGHSGDKCEPDQTTKGQRQEKAEKEEDEEEECLSGWAGADCDKCAPGHSGNACKPDREKEQSQHQPEEECTPGWAGADCDVCAPGHSGDMCEPTKEPTKEGTKKSQKKTPPPSSEAQSVTFEGADFAYVQPGPGTRNAFIKFFAPWCGQCKAIAPAWEQLAAEFGKEVVIGNVDCTISANEDLCFNLGVNGYPTLKYITPETGGDGLPYGGSRDLEALRTLVRQKLLPRAAEFGTVSLVGGEDFISEALGGIHSGTNAFVKFYAPWCGHCQAMAPAWEQLGVEFGHSVVIASVDCTAEGNPQVCNQQHASGYPTLKYYTAATGYRGQKYGSGSESGSGAKDFKSLRSFVRKYLAPECSASNQGGCTEQQTAFIKKMQTKGLGEIEAQVSRLEGMGGQAMTAVARGWLGQRLDILREMASDQKKAPAAAIDPLTIQRAKATDPLF